MTRIGMFGSENSHAMAFAKLFNGDLAEFSDVEVVAVGGEDDDATRRTADECGIPALVRSPREMLGMVDAVMITSRDGALHAGYAKPFLEEGMPVFVDKPFTRSIKEADELCALAQKHGSPVMGGSSVKLVRDVSDLAAFAADSGNGRLIGGSCWAPVNMRNPYGGFWFYASHLAEVCLRVFGVPGAVQIFRSGDDSTAIARYPSYDVALHYTEGAYQYGGTVLKEKAAMTKPIDISECYLLEAKAFAQMCRTGKMPEPFSALTAPVRFLDALARSLESGACEELRMVP